MTILKLTDAERWQLIISLKNDWMDNDEGSCKLIEKILNKLGDSVEQI